jgi:uncharacterized protein with PIN domain
MPVKVVDASAVAALLFGEPDGVEVATRLNGATLVAAALLPVFALKSYVVTQNSGNHYWRHTFCLGKWVSAKLKSI